ncbi:MAG: efflux RND transporter periplasmic adaptor subunit [Candidatus Zixiibacteriota bacterium]
MKKIIIVAVIVVAALAGGYFLFWSGGGEDAALAVQSKVVMPTRGDLRVTISSTGKVEPVKTVEVKSKASGEIIQLQFEEGDYVHQGDLLCKIDPEQVQFEYDKAVADLAVAKASMQTTEREVNRQKELFDKDMVSEAEMEGTQLTLEQARASLVRAQAAVADAKKRLDDTVVRSPISGLIIQSNVEEGNIIASGISNVSGGTALMQIAQVDSVYIVAQVDETDIGKVELGQKVEVEADAFPDETFKGEVLKIAPMAVVQQNVTIFEVTTKVDNAERKLKSGMNANIEIITAFAENALLVPNAAVKDPKRMGMGGETLGRQPGAGGQQANGGGAGPVPGNPEMAARFGEKFQDKEHPGKEMKLILVVENGQMTPRRVVVGASNLDFTQILEGISESDSIDATPYSQMMQDREQWRQRMSQMSGMPGMRTPGGGRR